VEVLRSRPGHTRGAHPGFPALGGALTWRRRLFWRACAAWQHSWGSSQCCSTTLSCSCTASTRAPRSPGHVGPLWRTAGTKPPGPRVPPLLLKFPGRVHLPTVTTSLAQALSTVLTVDETLKFNSAVSHGLSSYQQLLSSAAQAFQRDPNALPGATWGSVQALLHGVGQLGNQVLPPGGIFSRLCADLKAWGAVASAPADVTAGGHTQAGGLPGLFPNASALAEILSRRLSCPSSSAGSPPHPPLPLPHPPLTLGLKYLRQGL